MISGKRLIVVIPAYNAASSVEKKVADIRSGYVDEIILVDDFSRDHTFEIAKKMGLHAIRHPQNRSYGANQKTCYQEALKLGADVVVMLHPDYRYTPKLVVAMASMIATGQYDIVLASRIRCDSPIRGGMPVYKCVSNPLRTLFQNIVM